MKKLENLFKDIKKLDTYINNNVPEIIGKKSLEYYEDAFQKEAFDKKKWTPSKRKINSKGSAKNRKTLTGETGDLGRSIKYHINGNKIIFTSDKPYAKIHNQGGSAGKGKKVNIPKRQFMGKAKELDEIIKTKISNDIKKIFK